MSFNDVGIIYVKGSAYRIHVWYMSKDDVISTMSNSDLIDKKDVLYFFYNIYMIYIYIYIYKMSETTYCQRNKDVIIKRAKDYHKNDKERLREQARYKYRNLSEEEKKIKRGNMDETDIMSEEKKQNLKEYQKNTSRLKSHNLINKIVF